MSLSQADEAAVTEGLQAEALLAMPFFQKLLRDLSMEVAVGILDTDPEQAAMRELLYQKHQGLQAIEAALTTKVNVKESIVVRLEVDAAETPESE